MAQIVLIIGSTGMLGHQVLRQFENEKTFEVYDIVHRNQRREKSLICDAGNFKSLEEIITSIKPQFIINCVGVLIQGSKESKLNAINLNSMLPHFLDDLSKKTDFKLIQISTDCVFSGKTGNYHENSFRDADDIYGRSKIMGEIINESNLTIRTSIVGPELKTKGEGLLHWFLTTNSKEVDGYTKVYWSGVTTIELARAIKYAIQNEVTGLWNLTNSTAISKFEMLHFFNKLYIKGFEKKINPEHSIHHNKSLRSKREDILYKVPSYSDMFEEMMFEIKKFRHDYLHYRNIR